MSATRPRQRQRPRRDVEAASTRWLKGAATIAVVGGVVYLALSAYGGVPGRRYRSAYLETPRVGNLLSHDPVRIGGVRVGQVLSVGASSAGKTRVKLQLEPATVLPADTTAVVRTAGLLGARYVQLVPGRSAGRLADGATIHEGADALTNGIPEVLDALDRPTRRHLGTTLGELGAGLLGRGAPLNEAIQAVAPAVVPFQRLSEAVLARPGAAQRLVPALDGVMRQLDASRDDLAQLLRQGATGLRPLATEQTQLRQAIADLPSTLAATSGGAAGGRRLLAATGALARAANRTLPPAPAGLRATTQLLVTGRGPLARARTLLDTARPAIPAARAILRALSPVLPRLTEAARLAGPMSLTLGGYKCDIANFGAVFRSVTGFGGYGSGPGETPKEFRLQVVATPPTELLSANQEPNTIIPARLQSPPPCYSLPKQLRDSRGAR